MAFAHPLKLDKGRGGSQHDAAYLAAEAAEKILQTNGTVSGIRQQLSGHAVSTAHRRATTHRAHSTARTRHTAALKAMGRPAKGRTELGLDTMAGAG